MGKIFLIVIISILVLAFISLLVFALLSDNKTDFIDKDYTINQIYKSNNFDVFEFKNAKTGDNYIIYDGNYSGNVIKIN